MERKQGTYQSRINKANSRFTSSNPFLINTIKNSSERRSSSGSTTNKSRRALIENKYIITNSRNVRVSTTIDVIDTAIGAKGVVVRRRVVWVLCAGCGEVVRYGGGLVRRDAVNIRKASAGGEARDCCFRIIRSGSTGGEECRARGGEIGACSWEVGGEDCSSGAEAAVCVVVVCGASDARVAGCNDDGDALHA